MKKLIVVIGFLVLFGNGYTQWVWQNPHPVGSNLKECFFTGENTGYAVGWDGTIIKTTNGGVNWIQLNAGYNMRFSSVHFINQYTGFVISGNLEMNLPINNLLLKTTNEGITWNLINTFNNTHLSCIRFINNSTGFIVGRSSGTTYQGSIFKTTNSGNNWIQYSPNPTTNSINSVFFINDTVGYAAGDDSRILKTTNAGINWFSQLQGPPWTQLNSICFINSNTGITGGVGGWSFKTTNSGNNWIFDSTITNGSIWDFKFKDSNTGFIAIGSEYQGIDGKILRTTNSGNSWELMQTNNTQNYRSIFIIGGSVYSVGYWGTVVKSTNFGSNWTDLSNSMSATYNFVDAYLLDSMNFIIIGDSSKVYKTTDQGSSWNTIYLGGNYSLNSVYFTNQSTGYIAGGYGSSYPPYNYGKIYKSTNSGLSWNLIFGLSSEAGYMNSVKFISDLTGFCAGRIFGSGSDIGVVRKTTNGGLNWSTTTFGYPFNSICFVDSVTGYICGNNGAIYKTTNTGNNWVTLNSGITSNLFSIVFPSGNTGYAGGSNSNIIKTTNSGLNWFTCNFGLSNVVNIKCIYFFSNSTGFVVGTYSPSEGGGGEILKTTNGGLNWQRFSNTAYASYHSRVLNSIRFTNNNTGFIFGNRSTILKTTDGGGTIVIKSISKNIPDKYSLSQNYPNPFNPTTNIRYRVPSGSITNSSFVTLKIYDILGKEIATLVNEKQNAGTYEAAFDGSGLTSGIYFYRLTCGDFSETKKMVLLK